MKPARRILAVLLGAALLIGVLCACGKTTDTGTDTNDDSVAQQLYDTPVAAPDLTNAATITLSGTDDVTITDGGVYVLTGTLTDGRVLVNAPDADVTLVLQDADITCSDSSALYIYKAASVLLYLPDGTTSTLTDGSSYDDSDSFSSTTDEEPNACLYAKSGLIIAGGGTLTVTGNANNGITGKDTLKIEGTAVNVTAANHGINGKDCLVLKQANVTVTSGGDALRATNDSDSALGCILIGASMLTLTAGEDGIQAETTLTLFDTTGTITSGGGSSAALAGDTSAKGIKAGTDITIRSGSYTLDCADDGVHANGNVTISGGTFAITTGDDGVHADETVTITDGTLNIPKCYEGIEGQTIDISGGTIDIVSSDDGLNAAGGADQSGFGGRGPDRFGGSSDSSIAISGGTIRINASGDGIDSNGDLNVSGGEIYVSGPMSDSDSALDYDSAATVTGGTVVAAGYSGMAQNFGANSTQGSILLTCQSASTETIRVTDASGNVLAEFTPAKAYTCVVVSTPALTQGSTCTVTMGGQSTNVTLESLIYGSGGMGGGMGGQPGGNMGTPPDGTGGSMSTPPDGNNGGSMGTPPDGNKGSNMGTPPDGGKGGRPGQ